MNHIDENTVILGRSQQPYVTSYKRHSICVTGVPKVDQEEKEEETLFEEIITDNRYKAMHLRNLMIPNSFNTIRSTSETT